MNKKMIYILGLGNPGAEYVSTRHNAGRTTVELLAHNNTFPLFEESKKLYALTSEGVIAKKSVCLLLPETFMNSSGKTVTALKLTSKKQISECMIIIHDDLDLPLGSVRLVFNRGSAGHKGVESIVRSLHTKEFLRIRIGIAKASDITKSQSKTTVHKIVVGALSPAEKTALKKGIKKAATAAEIVLQDGLSKAMNQIHTLQQ